MRPYLRYLSIGWTALCAVIAVLLVVLWVRSYESSTYDWKQLSTNHGLETVTDTGHFTFRIADTSGGFTQLRPWRFSSEEGSKHTFVGDETRPKFRIKLDGPTMVVDSPAFVTVLAMFSAAGLPWLPYRRFSLRTLLIATTLVAVVLGLIVWLSSP